MTIPLPPLPEHLHHPELKLLDAFTREQVRAIQREAMRVALEAATKQVKSRFDYEAKAMAHHAGTWFAASQYHADHVRATGMVLDILGSLEIGHDKRRAAKSV